MFIEVPTRCKKSRIPALLDDENRVILWSFVLSQYERVTDGHAAAYASVAL